MELIHHPLTDAPRDGERLVELTADRATLLKRRWRGTAVDGREFGFDLDHAVAAGTVVFRAEGTCYVLAQAPERVLEIEFGKSVSEAASRAWKIGNLHFPVEVTTTALRVADDPAVRQMAEREGLTYHETMAVFQPIAAGAHGHHH